MVAKAGLGLIGLSAISVGGVALANPGWLGMGNSMPDHHSLANDKPGTESSEYSGKWADKRKNYLVGVTTKKDDQNNKDNQSWWEWSFERLKKNKPQSKKFKYVSKDNTENAVNTAYATDESNAAKALNQVCKSAYKADKNKVTTNGNQSEEYKEEDIWKYCSFLGEKPKTITDKEEGNNYQTPDKSIGKENKDKLISTTVNDKFWEIRDKEFKKVAGYGNIEETDDNFFKHDSTKNTTIRELCEKAYKLEAVTGSSTADKPTKEKTIKYCSLSE